jgi:DNA-binding SARP family transcriptional activator
MSPPVRLLADASAGAPVIAVRTLGAFAVLRDGTEVSPREWQSKMARQVLEILVSHRGRPVPRQRLIELLWPEQPPGPTSNRLSVLLSIVRRVLGPRVLVTDRWAIRLDLDLVDVDVERFLSSAAAARHAVAAGDGRAARLLRAAADLYAGDFLDEDPYEDWAEVLRDEARAVYVGLLRALAAHSADVDGRVHWLLRLVHREPYEEDAHLDLVRVLREAGRHGEAHRRYRAYAARMAELGIEAVPPQRLQLPPWAPRLVG